MHLLQKVEQVQKVQKAQILQYCLTPELDSAACLHEAAEQYAFGTESA